MERQSLEPDLADAIFKKFPIVNKSWFGPHGPLKTMTMTTNIQIGHIARDLLLRHVLRKLFSHQFV
jgi:hypothetical protein